MMMSLGLLWLRTLGYPWARGCKELAKCGVAGADRFIEKEGDAEVGLLAKVDLFADGFHRHWAVAEAGEDADRRGDFLLGGLNARVVEFSEKTLAIGAIDLHDEFIDETAIDPSTPVLEVMVEGEG